MLYYKVCHSKPVELYHAYNTLPTSNNVHWNLGMYPHSCCTLSMCRRHHERPCPEIEMNKNQPPQSFWSKIRPTRQWRFGLLREFILPEGFHLSSLSKFQYRRQLNDKVLPIWAVSVDRILGPWHGESTVCKTPRQELTICKRAIMVVQL
jgi:hypothetical protein